MVVVKNQLQMNLRVEMKEEMVQEVDISVAGQIRLMFAVGACQMLHYQAGLVYPVR